MDRWLSWLQEHPFGGALVILAGGGIGLAVLSVLLVPVFILAEANAVLGFGAFLLLLMAGGFGIQQLRNTDNAESAAAVDPVTELEGRYVRGELTDEEFERRLDKIVETEDEIDRATTPDRTRSKRREVDTERT